MKVMKDLCDSQMKDKLITSGNILMHIYDRCDKVGGKVNRDILRKRHKKTSTRLNDEVIVR